MSTYWTAECGGVEKTLENWGIQDPVLRLVSQGIDTCTFRVGNGEFDGTPVFAYGSTVTLRKGRTLHTSLAWEGGYVVFVGRVNVIPRMGTAGSKSTSYELVGPWWYLERLIFEQSWKSWNNALNGGDGAFEDKWSSHLFLGQTAAGIAQTTGDQVAEVLQFAVTKGAPFQLGTGFPEVTIRVVEVKDTLCAECIKLMLRWHPDAVTWFDYTTIPPTFHCRRRSELSAVTSAKGSPPLSEVQLTRRDDLTVPFVRIKFERTDTVNGIPYLYLTEQVAGDTGQAFGGLTATIPLLGYSRNYSSAVVTVATVAPTSVDWWKRRYPWLTHARVNNVAISGTPTVVNATTGGAISLTTYPTHLVEGQLAPWMVFDNGNPVLGVRATVTASMQVTYTDGGTPAKEYVTTEVLTANLNLTNIPYNEATSGQTPFWTLTDAASGEEPPEGLAAALYASLSEVHFSGQLVLHEQDCGDWLEGQGVTGHPMGLVWNVSGSHADWVSMRALVQEAELQLASGITRITVGPPGHLGPEDLAQLTLINRHRWSYTAPQLQSSGIVSDGGAEIALGDRVSDHESTSGVPVHTKQYVSEEFGMGSGSNTVQMLPTSLNGHAVAFREVDVCVYEGGSYTEKKMMVLGSEPYVPSA